MWTWIGFGNLKREKELQVMWKGLMDQTKVFNRTRNYFTDFGVGKIVRCLGSKSYDEGV